MVDAHSEPQCRLRTFRQPTWQHLCPLRYDRSYRFLLGLSVPLAAAPFELAALSRSAAEHGDESQNKPVERTIGCSIGPQSAHKAAAVASGR